ncbi:hypothetical protein [Nocardioides sp. NPDC006273]|uniref:hypothetical protein n=1 Tax=Nocardioides sp. NPDC006273 TaxID=3155598 RepID=UPI0033B8BD90
MDGIAEEVDSRIRRVLARSIAVGFGAAAIAVTLGAPATAAQPNHQACLGHDFRAYAEAGPGFGAFTSGLAADGGVGEEVQAHLAGAIPDAVIPNSCND